MDVPLATKPLSWFNIEGDLPLQTYEVLYDEGKTYIVELLNKLDEIAPVYQDFIFKNLDFSVRIEDSENPKFYILIEPTSNGLFNIIRFDGKKKKNISLNKTITFIQALLASRRASRTKIANMPLTSSTYNIKLTGPSDITNIYKLLAWIEDCGVKNISSTIEVHCDGTRVKWTVKNNKESVNSKTCEEIEL